MIQWTEEANRLLAKAIRSGMPQDGVDEIAMRAEELAQQQGERTSGVQVVTARIYYQARHQTGWRHWVDEPVQLDLFDQPGELWTKEAL